MLFWNEIQCMNIFIVYFWIFKFFVFRVAFDRFDTDKTGCIDVSDVRQV